MAHFLKAALSIDVFRHAKQIWPQARLQQISPCTAGDDTLAQLGAPLGRLMQNSEFVPIRYYPNVDEVWISAEQIHAFTEAI